MTGVLRTLGIWIVAVVAAAGSASAQSPLEPPFGLRWGDSPQKLIDWANRHSLDRNLFTPGDQPTLTVLKIQPRKGFLPETQAASVEGRFLAGKLFEVTVNYSDPEASSELMRSRFEEMRKQMMAEHGPLKPDQQFRSPVADQFVTRTEAFHREPVKGLFISLAFTEIEDLLRHRAESKFSLIYRNDNLKTEIEQLLANPEPGK